jgi:hypothetical protein
LLFNYLPFRYLHNRIDFFIFFSIARMRWIAKIMNRKL